MPSQTLLRQEHKCQSTCAASGICDIDTVPRSIEATFNGRHDKFQYTMVSTGVFLSVSVRLSIRLQYSQGSVTFRFLSNFNSNQTRPVAKRLPCVVPIDPGELSHLGTHRHSMEDDVFHYCEARWDCLSQASRTND